MAGSRTLITPGYAQTWFFSPRTYGGRAIQTAKISDVDGSWSFGTAADFAGGLTKAGAPVLAGAPFVLLAHVGRNGAGAVTVAGVKVGDKVVSVTNLSVPADLTSSFESTVTVAGQVQQSSATDLSAVVCLFYVVKQS